MNTLCWWFWRLIKKVNTHKRSFTLREKYVISFLPFLLYACVCVCVCACVQSQDGRVEVRGRHGKSMLTISGVKLSDLGRFDCEALSRIGGHQKSMFLDIECEYDLRASSKPILHTHVHTHTQCICALSSHTSKEYRRS